MRGNSHSQQPVAKKGVHWLEKKADRSATDWVKKKVNSPLSALIGGVNVEKVSPCRKNKITSAHIQLKRFRWEEVFRWPPKMGKPTQTTKGQLKHSPVMGFKRRVATYIPVSGEKKTSYPPRARSGRWAIPKRLQSRSQGTFDARNRKGPTVSLLGGRSTFVP